MVSPPSTPSSERTSLSRFRSFVCLTHAHISFSLGTGGQASRDAGARAATGQVRGHGARRRVELGVAHQHLPRHVRERRGTHAAAIVDRAGRERAVVQGAVPDDQGTHTVSCREEEEERNEGTRRDESREERGGAGKVEDSMKCYKTELLTRNVLPTTENGAAQRPAAAAHRRRRARARPHTVQPSGAEGRYEMRQRRRERDCSWGVDRYG